MIDKKALSDALTVAFIGYQHRLDCPMPIPHETEEMIILKYRTDPLFHAKVESMVSGVMRIVGEHLDGEPEPDVWKQAVDNVAGYAHLYSNGLGVIHEIRAEHARLTTAYREQRGEV